MEQSKIIEIVNEFLIDEFEVDGDLISNEANFRDTLGLDSLDYVDLVVTIESNLGVKLGEKDFSGVVSFQDFYEMLEERIKQLAD